MSKLSDYLDHWIRNNDITGSEEELIRRVVKDVLDFRAVDSFKTIPDDVVKEFRIIPHLQWEKHELGDLQIVHKGIKHSNYKIRCRCCKQIIDKGQEVIRFKYRSNFPFVLQGSIHSKESDCKELPHDKT